MDSRGSRRGSGESGRIKSPGERKHNCRHHRRRQSQQSMDSGSGVMPAKYYRSDQRPSASSTDSVASNAVRYIMMAEQSDARLQFWLCRVHAALSLMKQFLVDGIQSLSCGYGTSFCRAKRMINFEWRAWLMEVLNWNCSIYNVNT